MIPRDILHCQTSIDRSKGLLQCLAWRRFAGLAHFATPFLWGWGMLVDLFELASLLCMPPTVHVLGADRFSGYSCYTLRNDATHIYDVKENAVSFLNHLLTHPDRPFTRAK